MTRIIILPPPTPPSQENFLELFGGAGAEPGGVGGAAPAEPSYPRGVSKFAECEVCLLWMELNTRPCCGCPVCTPCLVTYFETQASQPT